MSACKKFPPFGRMLFELRLAGKIPAQTVRIVFDRNIARAYPRIVLDRKISPEKYKFNFLAWLPVQIVYHDKDAHRVDSVVQEILKANPIFLATFALDLVDDGMATTLIKPYVEIPQKAAA